MSIHEGLDQVGDDVSKIAVDTADKVADIENGEKGEEVQETRRITTMTEKGRQYHQEALFEKRKKLHARILRKFKLIDDLMYSATNLGTVKEETQ